MAQLVARLVRIEKARGSSPLTSTKLAGQRPCPDPETGDEHGLSASRQHKVDRLGVTLGRSRSHAAGRVHMVYMTIPTHPEGLGPVLTMSQLATALGVSVQTLYDLRSQGRGPRRRRSRR